MTNRNTFINLPNSWEDEASDEVKNFRVKLYDYLSLIYKIVIAPSPCFEYNGQQIVLKTQAAKIDLTADGIIDNTIDYIANIFKGESTIFLGMFDIIHTEDAHVSLIKFRIGKINDNSI